MGFSLENAIGTYALTVAAGANSGTGWIQLELHALQSREDTAWAAEVEDEGWRAPRLLGSVDSLPDTRLPHDGYLIMDRDGRVAVQADVVAQGALVFTVGRHLYVSPAPIFQTTEARADGGWRGWWWQPGLSGPGSHGHFCLSRR